MAEKGNGNSLELALAQIEKQFGKGAIMRLGDNEVQKVEAVSTGCLTLDIALGIGGIPKGRIIEIYGPESSGKTTVALHIVAEVQKAGGTAAFIDAEHALDPGYAARLGVQLENLYISQPDNGEQALDIVETLVRSGAIDVVVVDSVAALTPQAEIDGEMGDSQSSSSTSFARRWAWCTAARRRPRAARRSNSTPPCASTSAVRSPSRTAATS